MIHWHVVGVKAYWVDGQPGAGDDGSRRVCPCQTETHTLHVVNDTLQPATGELTVRDLDSGTVLFAGSYDVEANARTEAGAVPAAEEPAMWVLEWTHNDRRLCNHYLAGPRPFALDDFRRWLPALGLR